jgi:hypothetical protein
VAWPHYFGQKLQNKNCQEAKRCIFTSFFNFFEYILEESSALLASSKETPERLFNAISIKFAGGAKFSSSLAPNHERERERE